MFVVYVVDEALLIVAVHIVIISCGQSMFPQELFEDTIKFL